MQHYTERSVISAPLLRDDRSDYLGFISVHDILGRAMQVDLSALN